MEEEGEGKKVVQKADLSKHQVQVVSSLMSLNQETEAIEVRTPAVPRFTPGPAPAARVRFVMTKEPTPRRPLNISLFFCDVLTFLTLPLSYS